MKKLMLLVLGIVLLVLAGSNLWGQMTSQLIPFRIGLSQERIFLEPDPSVPGRYTLNWDGWITVESQLPVPTRLSGEYELTPLGQWTMPSATRFGMDLKPGINEKYQKFALGSIDLPAEGTTAIGLPSFTTLFDIKQSVKIKLAIRGRYDWSGNPPLFQRDFELKPLGYALLEAASAGDLRRARELVEKGADVDSADVSNWTALMEACANGHSDMVSFLVERGAQVNVRRKGFPFVVSALGARVPAGATALMAACFAGDVASVRLLLQSGAKTSYERSDRWTSLMAACYGGRPELVRLLLEHGAPVSVTDELGYSAMALARINGNAGAFRLLKARGETIRVPWDKNE